MDRGDQARAGSHRPGRIGRIEPAQLDAALERAREQVEALAPPRPSSSRRCPAASATRSRTGCARRCARSAATSPRSAASMNQLIRRLERVEGDLLAERHARVDDLALLVDLVSSGWRGVEQRLARIEERASAADDAVVYRIEEPGPAAARAGNRCLRAAARARSGCRAPGSLSRSMRPPSATASSRAIARPSPVPPPSRDQNGRKMRSRSALLMPGPAVRDRDATPRRSRPTASARRVPPSGVHRNAFESRFDDDLQHAVAVADDHRLRVDRRAIVDLLLARLLAERRERALESCSMSTSSCSTVKRCASSFARSRTSPTSRSSRIASVADHLERLLAHRGIVDDALAERRRRGRGSRSAAYAARATPT